MDILFLGGVFDENEIAKKSKGNVQFAANALQWNIIKGLDACNNKPIRILNSVFVGSYPKSYKELIIKSYSWSHEDGAIDNNVGFINIAGIKHISRARRLSYSIRKWAKDGKDKQKIVIAYSAHTPFLCAIKSAKKINPDIKTCLIVPDLPQYMRLSENEGKVYSVLKRIDCKIIYSLLRYIDSYVLLTKYMVEPLGIRGKQYIVMEGMVNPEEVSTVNGSKKKPSKIKSILYTGTLNKKYGILILLEAFELIKKDNYQLWICGAGEAEEDITKISANDHRIKFFGRVSRKEALRLQRKATVLINPRKSEEVFTKYSFPSKNMEYLRSGRPTIAYKLPGIPAEYEEYMFFIEDETAQGMAKKIIEACEKDPEELFEFGKKAQQFVIEEKNNIKQAQRIINMIVNDMYKT